MKTTIAWLLLLTTLHAPRSTVFAQGPLTPPGAPAPLFKTLNQVEPRTPISSAPFTITNSGSYYLTSNLTTAVSNAIVIATNGVTLDLGGFTIFSTVTNAINGGSAILLSAGSSDVAIVNGNIRGGVTNNGSGVFSGPGFAYGIYYSVSAPGNVRVAGVSVAGCFFAGINLGRSDSTVVEACTVRTIGGYGIIASTVKSSVAVDCDSYGINGDQVSDSRGETVGILPGLGASVALNCYGVGTTSYGLSATTAQNCHGSSTSGTGLFATTAQNCYGSSTSGHGLVAGDTASNCSGTSGGNGTGVSAGDVAMGCRGSSNTGIGLSAFIANSCRGTSTSGTPLSTTHNVNSF